MSHRCPRSATFVLGLACVCLLPAGASAQDVKAQLATRRCRFARTVSKSRH